MPKIRSTRRSDFLARVYHRSPKVVARRIADEYILVPVEEGAGDRDAIYTLNAVGRELWQRLDGEKTLRQIAAELFKKYQVSRTILESDVRGFIKALEKIRAVVCR